MSSRLTNSIVSMLFATGILSLVLFVSCGNQGESSFKTASQDSSLSTEELVQAIQSLEMKIENLDKTMREFYSKPARDFAIPKDGISFKEDSLVRLEKAIDRLVDVASSTSLSSERNTILRRNYETSRDRESPLFKELWNSAGTAKKELFMMTYSQILEKLGPPQLLLGGPEVIWQYQHGSVTFIDGIVSDVHFHK